MFRPASASLPSRQVTAGAVTLSGGLDLSTDRIILGGAPNGVLRFLAASNYELDIKGNPRRVDGYERFDGQVSPSDQNYSILGFDAGEGAISDGDTVEGATSGATGIALVDAVVDSGDWGTNDAAGSLVLWVTSGTFQDDEDLEVSSVKKAVADGVAVLGGASSGPNHTDWRFLAIEEARAQIQKVPGSGPVRGVQWYSGALYAFRDNAGATAQVLHKSTSSGWQAVTLGETIDFTAGTAEVVEGEVITGGTSGATATIDRVVVQSGSWGSAAAGFLVLSGRSGTFQAETGTTPGGGSLTLSGASSAITLQPGGRWEIILANFYGEADYERMYGVDGVNEGFEFDGTVFTPLRIPDMTQKPYHIAKFATHLFLGFDSGRLNNSSLGQPLVFNAITGANDVGAGKGITGLRVLSSALLILCGDETHYMIGSDQASFEIKPHRELTGAVRYSVNDSPLGLLYLDTHGLTALAATDRSGDFQSNTIDENIRTLMTAIRPKLACSGVVRGKNQYRLLANDGSGIVLSVNDGRFVGFTEISYPHSVYCWASERDENQAERVFFGTSDGYVMEAERGTSFDGAAITAVLRPHYFHAKTPEMRKQFLRTTVVMSASSDMGLYVTPDYEFGDTREIMRGLKQAIAPPTPGGSYGVGQYGIATYGSPESTRTVVNTRSKSLSVGFRFVSESARALPHTLVSLIHQYSFRRMAR